MDQPTIKEEYRAEDWGGTKEVRKAARLRVEDLQRQGYFVGTMSVPRTNEGAGFGLRVWAYRWDGQVQVIKPLPEVE